MIPRTPEQALLWRSWNLAWKPFIATQLVLLAVSLPLLAMFAGEMEADDYNEGTATFLFVFVVFFWAASMKITTPVEAGWRTTGYPHKFDFVQPISSATLVMVPLGLMSLLWVLAYAIPATIYQWLFDTSGASWFICILIIAIGNGITCLNWWSSDDWSCLLGWAIAIFLYIFGPLRVDLLTDEATGISSLANPADMVPIVLLIPLLVWLAVAGVSRQRHGEELLALSKLRAIGGINTLASLPFFKGECPTGSAIKAQAWYERRYRGLANHAFYGALAALVPLIIVGSVRFLTANPDPVEASALIALFSIGLFIIFIAMAVGVFSLQDLSVKSGLGDFQLTRPLNTTSLVMIKFTVIFAGMLTALLSLYVTMRLFGPLFIVNFSELNAAFNAAVRTWLNNPPGQVAANVILLSVYLLCGQLIVASKVAWIGLHSDRIFWYFLPVPLYVLGVALVMANLDLNDVTVRDVILSHLWILVIAIPVLTVYFLRVSWRDRVLSAKQMAILLVTSGALFLLFVLQPENPWSMDPTPERLLERLLGYTAGIVPLFAASLGLFTLNRMLHR